MAAMSFLYPKQPLDLGSRVQALPTDGSVPHLPGWRWYHTPGHTPGHVSFFREEDRLLIAGDAFVTVKQESGTAVWEQRQEVHGPPAYFTPNWPQARQSVAFPKHGRYVPQPATADETGVTSVPPAVGPGVSTWALGLGVAGTVALVLLANKKGKKSTRY
jgi:glyoxylase-like metal-dependent hydrolase (beta-lactamase superfamily II)